MIAALSLALFSSVMPHHAAAPPARVSAHVQGWTYEIKTDSFTGQKTCSLRGRDRRSNVAMTVVGGSAIAFRLAHHVGTDEAVYRVDNGQPHAVRDDKIALILAHVAVPDDSLAQNDASGLVLIPTAALTGAKQVAIRANPKTNPSTVSLAGLDSALAAARDQGCGSTSYAQLDLAQ